MQPPSTIDLAERLAVAVRVRDLDAVVEHSWQLYHSALQRLCLRAGIPEDHVDDVINDAYVRVVNGFHRFEGARFTEWLFTLVRYEMLSARGRLKAQQGRCVDVSAELPSGHPDALEAVTSVEFAAVMASLSADWDPVTELLFDESLTDLSSTELSAVILERLGVPIRPSTLDVRRFRARARVAAELKRLGVL